MMCIAADELAVILGALLAALALAAWSTVQHERSLKRAAKDERASLKSELHFAQDSAARAERQLAEVERHRDNMFNLVAQIEKERNEWAQMHIADSIKHAATYGVYDRELRNERVRIFHLLEDLNKYRAAEGKEPIKRPKHLDSELGIETDPLGKVNEYVKWLEDLYVKGHPDFVRQRKGANRPPDTDGQKERQALAEWRQEPEEAEEA